MCANSWDFVWSKQAAFWVGIPGGFASLLGSMHSGTFLSVHFGIHNISQSDVTGILILGVKLNNSMILLLSSHDSSLVDEPTPFSNGQHFLSTVMDRTVF